MEQFRLKCDDAWRVNWMVYLNCEALLLFLLEMKRARVEEKRYQFRLLRSVKVLQKNFRKHLARKKIGSMDEKAKKVLGMLALKWALKFKLRARRNGVK